MEPVACARCGADLLDGARFCTACGTRVDPAARGTADATPPRGPVSPSGGVLADDPGDDAPVLVECEACGAGNAASRALCAVCGAPLREEVPGGDALPADLGTAPPAIPPPGTYREGPSLLLALVVLAGLVTAGVLLSLVTSRVSGPGEVAVPRSAALAGATASTAVEGADADRVADGDPATAWVAEPGDPLPAVAVELAEAGAVHAVVIWNGHQAGTTAFDEHGRAGTITIEVGTRRFQVVLRDMRGPQVIDLPEPVPADGVRVVVEEVLPGTAEGAPAGGVAIGEIAVDVEDADA